MSYKPRTSIERLSFYLKERFPVIPLALYSTITALAINSSLNAQNLKSTFGVALFYVLFLFHLRVLDEFKDYHYDNKNHQDRPVQVGLVKLSFIRTVGIINFFLLLSIAYLISPVNVFLLSLTALFYTGLMFKEFFIPNYLRRHVVLYLISHELVLIPLFLFFFSAINKKIWLITNLSRFSTISYAAIPLILIEIGRKLKHRYNKKGQKTNDTYAYFWGEKRSIRIFAILIFLTGIFSFFIPSFDFYFSFLILTTAGILFLGSYLFPELIINNNMLITSLLALGLPFLLFL